MEEFVKVATLSDIEPGQRKAVWVSGQRVLLVNVDGTIYAIDESCPHRECSMLKGQIDGQVITCPCHAARFNLETGEIVAPPNKYPPTPPLPVHETKIEKWDVLVALSYKADAV